MVIKRKRHPLRQPAAEYVRRQLGRVTAPELADHLGREYPGEELPDVRTLNRWIGQVAIEDTSGPWTIGDPDFEPEDLMPILRVMAFRMESNERHRDKPWFTPRQPMTRDLARSVARLARAVPAWADDAWTLEGWAVLCIAEGEAWVTHELAVLITKGELR